MKRSIFSLLCCFAALAMASGIAVAAEDSPTNALHNLLDSPFKGEGAYNVDADVLRETPHVGTSAFGIMQDLSDNSIWVNDLFTGNIHQYDDELNFLQTVAAIGGVTTSGFAYDNVNDTFWILDFTSGNLLTEIDKTGTPTGNSIPTGTGGLVGPVTIDPGDTPGNFWCEEIVSDVVFEIRFSDGAILNTHANPDNTGGGAFGNGLSYFAHDVFSDPGDLAISSGTLTAGQVERISVGQPSNPGLPRVYVEEYDVSAISTFVNGIQSSTDPDSGDEVYYIVDNAGNRVLQIGVAPPPPAILSCAPGAVNLGTATPDFFDDMESGQLPHWTVSSTGFGTTDWAIITDADARSPVNVWFVPDEGTIADKFLDLTVDIAAPFTTLEFYHYFDMETGFDGGVLEISTDGGTIFTDLELSILEGGYNGTISTAFGNPIGGQNAWTGVLAPPMSRVAADLSAFDGTIGALVRWRHASDSSVSDVGWWMDDVGLIDPNDPCTGGPATNTLFLNRSSATATLIDDLDPVVASWNVSSTGFGTTDWAVISDANARSPVNVWFVPDEGTIADKFLDLTVDIPAAADTKLEFWHYFDMETGFDGGVLELSTDGGTVFNDLEADILEGGYTGSISTAFGNPIGGQNAWTGVLGPPMERVVVDLSAVAGTTGAIFRWRHASDSSVSDVGWWMDDFSFLSGVDNDGDGGADFTIDDISAGDSVTVEMDEAPSRLGDATAEGALLYVWLAEPTDLDIVSLPKGLGDMCFGTFAIATVAPKKVFNGIGRVPDLGPNNKPITLNEIGTVIGSRASVAQITATLQGIIPDTCTIGTKPFSVTNGILLKVQP